MKKLTIVKFRAFDMPQEQHYFDKDWDSAIKHIWKHICDTAHITSVTEYDITIDATNEIKDFPKLKP